MVLLFKKSIIAINRRTIEAHGGNFVPPENFLHEEVLNYTVEAVNESLFGEAMYPSLSDKAAFYMYQIISGHIFQDGNKRTGLEAALTFLQLNNADLIEELTQVDLSPNRKLPEEGADTESILFNFTIEMASGKITLDQARQWFAQNIQQS